MTSLQNQYLLCPPLACNTARPISAQTRSIDEYGLVGFSPILAQEPDAVLAEFAVLVDDGARVDPNDPTHVLLGSNLVIQTAREQCYVLVGNKVNSNSTNCVRPSVVVLKNVPTEVHFGQHEWSQNLISVSSSAKVAGDVHQLSFSDVGYDTPLPPTKCRPEGRSSLRSSHSGVCRHVYGHFFSAACILIHR